MKRYLFPLTILCLLVSFSCNKKENEKIETAPEIGIEPEEEDGSLQYDFKIIGPLIAGKEFEVESNVDSSHKIEWRFGKYIGDVVYGNIAKKTYYVSGPQTITMVVDDDTTNKVSKNITINPPDISVVAKKYHWIGTRTYMSQPFPKTDTVDTFITVRIVNDSTINFWNADMVFESVGNKMMVFTSGRTNFTHQDFYYYINADSCIYDYGTAGSGGSVAKTILRTVKW